MFLQRQNGKLLNSLETSKNLQTITKENKKQKNTNKSITFDFING